MNKSKILALTLSAISTGILISCAKPVETTDQTDQKTTDNVVADSTGEVNEANDNQAATKLIEVSDEKTTAFLQQVAQKLIVPSYTNAATASKNLTINAKQLCSAGKVTKQDLKTLQKDWLALAAAWAKAEAINFGPANENMANLYINYFPDERGLVHKSVNALIGDNPNLNAEQFADESAIVQGIPALEDILFSQESLDNAQCQYVTSATAELTRRLAGIAATWQRDANTILDTANSSVGMNQYFNSLLFHIENLKSTGIDKPLALTGHKKGHVPAHTAKQSKQIVLAKIDILQTALADDELVKLIGDDENGAKMLAEMTATITETKNQLATLPTDITQANKEQQLTLLNNLTTLTKQMKRELMPLFGIQIGFNSTDGD